MAGLDAYWAHTPDILREFGLVVLSRGNDDPEPIISRGERLRTQRGRITLADAREETKAVSSTRLREIIRAARDVRSELF